MKTQHTLILLFYAFLFLNLKCKKENEPQLPPETTTGAMTFGCKIDGKVFVPKTSIDGPAITAQYIFLGTGPGGGWFLNLYGANRVDDPRTSVSIETDSLLLQSNSYSLKKEKGSPVGSVLVSIMPYDMGLSDNGILEITKHDQTQRILSGRFSFTATNGNGVKVNITEGRFDIRY